MRELSVGEVVNIEADVLGKYVERLLEPRLRGAVGSRGITEIRSIEDVV